METPQTQSNSIKESELLPGMQKLTPMEMNNIGFSKKHTVLTPEMLKKIEA